jgi:hypothetical protein
MTIVLNTRKCSAMHVLEYTNYIVISVQNYVLDKRKEIIYIEHIGQYVPKSVNQRKQGGKILCVQQLYEREEIASKSSQN